MHPNYINTFKYTRKYTELHVHYSKFGHNYATAYYALSNIQPITLEIMQKIKIMLQNRFLNDDF